MNKEASADALTAAFIAAARISARMPSFRGKTRLLLRLHRLLGLEGRHVLVQTVLQRPRPFHARLDLHSLLQRIAFLTGAYEADTVSFLLRLYDAAGSRGYVLDIGANVGLLALPLALSLSDRQSQLHSHLADQPLVICVEAVKANIAALEQNIASNKADRLVQIIEAALGDSEKLVDIQIEGNLRDDEGTGTANIIADGSTYQCVRIPLALTTLDALVDSKRLQEGCSVIKIDTDGYDLKVLQGARRFLETNRPVIFGEFSAHCLGWHQQSLSDVLQFAEQAGYAVFSKDERGWSFSPSHPAKPFIQDLLLLPSEQLGRFSWCLSSSAG